MAQQSVHRIPGGTRNLGDDHSLFTDDAVDHRRLADVGTPEKGQSDGIVRNFLTTAVIGQRLAQALHQGGESIAVLGRHAPQLVDAQFIKRNQQFLLLLGTIDFVDHKEDLFVHPAQQTDHFVIGGHQPLLTIHNEKNDVRFLDGGHGLGADILDHRVFGIVVDAARIDQHEEMILPDDPFVLPVPGDPRSRVDNGLA